MLILKKYSFYIMDCKFYTRHRKSFIKLCDLDVSKIGVIIGANKLIPDDLRIVKELLYLLFNEQRINNIFKLTKITSNPDIVSVPYNSVSVKKTQKEIKEISQNNFVVGKYIILIIIKSSNS